jgi:hypothetical protein
MYNLASAWEEKKESRNFKNRSIREGAPSFIDQHGYIFS